MLWTGRNAKAARARSEWSCTIVEDANKQNE